MRAVDCPCGEHLEAGSDAALIQALIDHANEEHPGRYEESELRLLVTTAALQRRRLTDHAYVIPPDRSAAVLRCGARRSPDGRGATGA